MVKSAVVIRPGVATSHFFRTKSDLVTLQFLPLENAPKPMEIPAKDPKIMEKVLYNFDLLSHIGCYLDAESIILNCSIVNKHFLHLLDGSNKTMENHFRVLLSKDLTILQKLSKT